MIDLHSHTNESDGTYTPQELVETAKALGLEALGITDHDTFAGFDQAQPLAQAAGLDLVCGIELSTRMTGGRSRAVHLLGYFLDQSPTAAFRAWLSEVLQDRRDRNIRLVESLQAKGVQIELSEVERMGRTLTGRPHFARLLVRKGYAATSEEAFRKYLDESAPTYVERRSPHVAEGIQRLLNAGGMPVLAHPVRLGVSIASAEEALIGEMRDMGLRGIEVFHSDHRPADVERYLGIARKFDLAVTGGSDFHGDAKPQIALGTGWRCNINIPKAVLDQMRARAA